MNGSLSFDSYYDRIKSDRVLLQRVFFLLALIALLLNYQYHIMLSQIGRNPILYQEIDPMYWLFMLLQLPDIIVRHIPILFEVLLVLSCCCSFIWPRQNLSASVFCILYFIYFILYNMLAGHHYINIGLLFMSFPFVFSSGKKVAFAFIFIRFVFCFMMFTAALWKIGRGNLFHTDQLFVLFLPQYIANTVSHNASLHAVFTAWLLHHKYIVHGIWLFLIFLEALFAAGFLTFKYDLVLLISYLLFFAGGWVLLNVYNYENLLFLLTLTPVLNGMAFLKSAGHCNRMQKPGLNFFKTP